VYTAAISGDLQRRELGGCAASKWRKGGSGVSSASPRDITQWHDGIDFTIDYDERSKVSHF